MDHRSQNQSRRPNRRAGTLHRRRLLLEQLESRKLLTADGIGTPEPLRDIHQQPPSASPTEFVKSGDKIFLVADDSVHGRELFWTDGDSPPQLVKDILPGLGGSDPTQLIDIGGTLFFTANDGQHGRELWKSDGTQEGTELVHDIFPGQDGFGSIRSSNPSQLTAAPIVGFERLFFVATTEDEGQELWMADENGAEMVVDLFTGTQPSGTPNSAAPRDLTFWKEHFGQDANLVPPTLFFSAETDGIGRELWQTVIQGGTTTTTLVKNIFEDIAFTDPRSSDPTGMIVFQNHLYFAARGGEVDDNLETTSEGRELWRTDGTEDGTELVSDIFPGFLGGDEDNPANSSPNEFTVHNGTLFFTASSPARGRELWKLSDDEPELVRDIRSGSLSSTPKDLISADGQLFFTAETSVAGRELWRSDGTTFGTQLVKNIRPGSATPFLFTRGYAAIGQSIIFGADDGTLGPEVWISDGTSAGTSLLKETQFGRNSAVVPEHFTHIDGFVFFESAGDIWRTDGSEQGTVKIPLETPVTLDAEPSEFTSAQGTMFFAADDGIHGRELWKSDGTPGGTMMVRDIFRGDDFPFAESSLGRPGGADPEEITAVGDNVFFRARSNSATGLWKSDGTFGGTMPLLNTEPSDLVHLNGKLFFTADSPDAGNEIWVSDGTVSGTHVIHDLGDEEYGSYASELTVAGNQLFFVADNGVDGRELWVSDGTVDGARLIDIAVDGSSFPDQLTPVANRVYFTADDGITGNEVWVSDGTVEGTQRVNDLNTSGGSSAQAILLGELDGALLFFADDGFSSQALWRTEGTVETTDVVRDIKPLGRDFYFDYGDPEFDVVGQLMFFPADDGDHGVELWQTDGTEAGTRLVQDLLPGPAGSYPSSLHAVDNQLFFAADGAVESPGAAGGLRLIGRELFVSDGADGTTELVAEINEFTDEGSNPQSLASVGGTLWFSADDGIKGFEPWVTRVPFDSAVVNSTGDAPDSNPGDGVCATGNFIQHSGGEDPECTLRAAIMESNASGSREVSFDIPAATGPQNQHTFTPASALPEITRPIIIDGTTQPGFLGTPVIEIDGSQAGSSANGLVISAGQSTVKGLAINRFTGQGGGRGIKITGGSSNIIVGNHVGIDVTGDVVDPDGQPDSGDEFGNRVGIEVVDSSDHRIGSTLQSERNLISGNLNYGIAIEGSASRRNVVSGNYIGTNAGGVGARGEQIFGVYLHNARENQIGGIVEAAANLISGNADGVRIAGEDAFGNTVFGNLIGPDQFGESSIGNRFAGVSITGGFGNQIGGTDPGTGNVISGNPQFGVVLDGADTINNRVTGNLIGLNASGTRNLGNTLAGIRIVDAVANQIGEAFSEADEFQGNVIGGSQHGIRIEGVATQNVVLGNRIGTDPQGELPVERPTFENSIAGITIEDAFGNLIGNRLSSQTDACAVTEDSTSTSANVIAGNLGPGIRITGDSAINNRLRCNAVYGNEGIGIDLGEDEITANDPDDADSGPNRFQNFPVISYEGIIDGHSVVTGTLTGLPDAQYVIDFYATDTSTASTLENATQGGRAIGSLTVNTDDLGRVHFRADTLGITVDSEVITATATDSNGSTSEFSQFTPDFIGADQFEVRTPVILLPGIFGSFSRESTSGGGATTEYLEYLLTLGIEQDSLELDPLVRVYRDIVRTLQRAGYTIGEDLFLAPYDWRINLAPLTDDPTQHDGNIDTLTAEDIVSGDYEYGLDYLGRKLKEAAETWYELHEQPLSNVHIIAHSMGGLLARSYIQSDTYGDTFPSDVAGRDLPLPTVANYTTLGTPHQGGIGPWNAWNDNFGEDVAYRLVMSKVLSHAWHKMQAGEDIDSSSGVLTKSDFDGMSEREAKTQFVRRYAAGLGNLLPSWDGFGQNFLPQAYDEFQNFLLQDLNARLTFADRVARTSTLFGASETTASLISHHVYDPIEDLLDLSVENFVLSFTDYVADNPATGEIYFQDVPVEANGDKTVALESLEGLFIDDERIDLFPFCNTNCRPGDLGTAGAVSHTSLVSNVDAQSLILDLLHHPIPTNLIATGSEIEDLDELVTDLVVPWAHFNFFVDPVSEALLIDADGNRLGFSDGETFAEFELSQYYGGSDGVGWIHSEVDTPLRLEVVGKGENHLVQVTGFDERGFFGIESSGFLADGERRIVDVVRDVVPQSIAFISPFAGSDLIIDQTVDLATDVRGDIPTVRVDYFIDDALLASVAEAPYIVPFSPDQTGTFTLRAVAIDENGAETETELVLRVVEGPVVMPDSVIMGSGSDGSGAINVYDPDGGVRVRLIPFAPGHPGGIPVATGDVNGDGTPDIVAGLGKDSPSLVRVFDGVTANVMTQFQAFELPFLGGVSVATGDVNGDGIDEVIVAPGAGRPNPVSIFNGQTGSLIHQFFPFSETFQGGITVAAGDVNGDGLDEMIVGQESTDQPMVHIYRGDSAELIQSFLHPRIGDAGSLTIAAGDLNGDGLADIVTGAGSGADAQVTVFNSLHQPEHQFRGFNDPFDGLLRIATGDVNSDGRDDIIVSSGVGSSRVSVFDANGTPIGVFDGDGTSSGSFATGVKVSVGTDVIALPQTGSRRFFVFDDAGDLVVQQDAGDELFRAAQESLGRVRVVGPDDIDDTLVVNFNGLATPLTFNGGDGGHDTLELAETQIASGVRHAFFNATDGFISIGSDVPAVANLHYTGLEPIVDQLESARRQFLFPNTSDNIRLESFFADETNQLRVDSDNSESVEFVDSDALLEFLLGAGDDRILVSTSKLPDIDGMDGRDELVIDGNLIDLDLGQANITSIESFDVTGSGENSVTLRSEDVERLAPLENTLYLRHDEDDTISYAGSNWSVQAPEFINGEMQHVLSSGTVSVRTINTRPHQNPHERTDVNFNGETSPLDALLIINVLGRFQASSIDLPTPTSVEELPERYFDVNGNGFASPSDALAVINFLAIAQEGKGEAMVATADASANVLRQSSEESRPQSQRMNAPSTKLTLANDPTAEAFTLIADEASEFPLDPDHADFFARYRHAAPIIGPHLDSDSEGLDVVERNHDLQDVIQLFSEEPDRLTD